MAGEGQILRNARVDRGWSLTQAEEVTKIRIRYLEALEEEEYHVLPGSTYTKGFLRTYAKHLGIDTEEVLALYRASEQSEEPAISEHVPSPPGKKPQWIRPALIAITGTLALGIVIGIASLSKPPGTGIAPEDITPPLPTAPEEEIVQQQTPELPSLTPPQDPQSAIVQETEGVVAQLVFSQPCWVRVNVDGKLALEGTFTKGVTKELRGKEQIELVTVGNAGGVTVILNGETYPSLGAPNQVVNNIILKKDTQSQVSLIP